MSLQAVSVGEKQSRGNSGLEKLLKLKKCSQPMLVVFFFSSFDDFTVKEAHKVFTTESCWDAQLNRVVTERRQDVFHTGLQDSGTDTGHWFGSSLHGSCRPLVYE